MINDSIQNEEILKKITVELVTHFLKNKTKDVWDDAVLCIMHRAAPNEHSD